jgi:hypothetical protein
MSRHLLLRIPQPPKRGVHRVVRHRSFQREQRREDLPTSTRERVKLARDRHGLARERYDAQLAPARILGSANVSALSQVRWDLPDGLLEGRNRAAARRARVRPQAETVGAGESLRTIDTQSTGRAMRCTKRNSRSAAWTIRSYTDASRSQNCA